ncbi:MAG: hypothetical protein RBR66_02350 [Candidatus Izemoplasmatales bacterium]|jgi:hypothetical protein|nr:hypothetical protein [Candidatus Izemoplasmatales bacterium]
MKNLKRKNLVLALLVVLALAVAGTTYAYWASSINVPENTTSTGTVTVGTGNAVQTSYVLTPGTTTGGALVPASQLTNSPSGSVDEVVVNYGVQWVEDGTTSQLDGTTSTAPITVSWVITVEKPVGTDQSALVSDLVVVTPAANPENLTLDADPQNFVFTITMTEPANQAEYDAISGATITITFTYSLGTVTTTDN